MMSLTDGSPENPEASVPTGLLIVGAAALVVTFVVVASVFSFVSVIASGLGLTSDVPDGYATAPAEELAEDLFFRLDGQSVFLPVSLLNEQLQALEDPNALREASFNLCDQVDNLPSSSTRDRQATELLDHFNVSRTFEIDEFEKIVFARAVVSTYCASELETFEEAFG